MNETDKGDIVLSFAPFFQIAVLMLQQILVDSNIVAHESFRKVSIILSAIPIIISLVYIIQRKFLLFSLTYLFVLIILFITAIFSLSCKQYIKTEVFYLLCVCIPCFLCISSILNVGILKRTMLILSYAIFFLGIIYYALVWSGKNKFTEYSMSYSYYLLLPALVFISQKRLILNVAFIMICIMMLMIGSRGALYFAIIYALTLTFIDSKRKYLVFLIFLVIFIFSNKALNLFESLASSTGISSRTIIMLREGNIVESASRLKIFSDIWDSIINGPVMGHGLYGDRVILQGGYCHNIALEILHDFGLVFGGGLLLLLFSLMIRIFIRSDLESKKLFLLFACYGFLQFLVSGSYLKSPEFGIFLGFLYFQSDKSLYKTRSKTFVLPNLELNSSNTMNK